MIIRNKKDISHVDILEKIKSRPDRDKYTYIILGKCGPTGKTWLTRQLQDIGLNAVEITDYLLGAFVRIDTDNKHNYFITDDYKNVVTIVLNSPIEWRSYEQRI